MVKVGLLFGKGVVFFSVFEVILDMLGFFDLGLVIVFAVFFAVFLLEG